MIILALFNYSFAVDKKIVISHSVFDPDLFQFSARNAMLLYPQVHSHS